jgi:hypothetical protein
MPLHKPTDIDPTEAALAKIQEALEVADDLPVEAYHYEAELKVEVVKRIQAEADKVLNQDEWVVIDGVDKR